MEARFWTLRNRLSHFSRPYLFRGAPAGFFGEGGSGCGSSLGDVTVRTFMRDGGSGCGSSLAEGVERDNLPPGGSGCGLMARQFPANKETVDPAIIRDSMNFLDILVSFR
jgi:hypothetical protein